jgi:histone-lysine N-methyltransferase MLL2/histone-lysine N-methyltransferase MLL3
MQEIIIENDDAPNTYVKESNVQGLGLFATYDIKKNDLVIDYRLFPRDWKKVRYVDLSAEQIEKNWYVMLDDEECLTSDKWSKFSYINHSREPNCDWVLSIHKIIANRDIKKDEELFIDYRLEPQPSGVRYPEWI